jgi:hypothetical protein
VELVALDPSIKVFDSENVELLGRKDFLEWIIPMSL